MDVELDLNFENLTKYEILNKYTENLQVLKNLARANNISDQKFHQFVRDQLERLPERRPTWYERYRRVRAALEARRRIIKYITIFIVIYALIFYKRPISSYLLRHVQVYIYPGMKLWRKITAPLLLFFPSLTELYDESCLVSNPFFQVDGLNCSPCSSVVIVLDLTKYETHLDMNVNMPFIFRLENQPRVSVQHVNDIFNGHRAVFKRDAFKVKSTDPDIRTLADVGVQLLNRTNRPESHSVWRSNRMKPARIIRTLFPHPDRLPATGTSLERFLLIDTPNAPLYRIPETECANVFLIQATGNRKIVLMPTKECTSQCRSLSILLPTSYVLRFNWWYYKPISLPPDGNVAVSDAVTYVGSYC